MKQPIIDKLIARVQQDAAAQSLYAAFALEAKGSEDPVLVGGIPSGDKRSGALVATTYAVYAAKHSGASAIYFAADAWFRSITPEQAEAEKAEHGRELSPSDFPLDDRQSVIFITRVSLPDGATTALAFQYKMSDPRALTKMDALTGRGEGPMGGVMADAIRAGIAMARGE